MDEIRKKIDKIEEMREQIRLEKEKMNTQIGRQLLSKLNIQHEDLSKEKIDELLDTLTTLYQEYQMPVKHHD
ncbi:hypothetical protein [Sporosarcina limicola]|uniref:Regulator of replication initiation timing n=1 Tax=Sporosarcina limicola TaxID=34101 RepID=A0A927R8M1_9BACL|nr:hypothetical protein [Sporosarcina limicola]MBE1557144.1 regulator of replication initiation timing [Sporosarcina limicola]